MLTNQLSPDAQVIILVCSYLAIDRNSFASQSPLTFSEWRKVKESLEDNSPSILLEKSSEEISSGFNIPSDIANKIVSLLGMGGSLAFYLEDLF